MSSGPTHDNLHHPVVCDMRRVATRQHDLIVGLEHAMDDPVLIVHDDLATGPSSRLGGSVRTGGAIQKPNSATCGGNGSENTSHTKIQRHKWQRQVYAIEQRVLHAVKHAGMAEGLGYNGGGARAGGLERACV